MPKVKQAAPVESVSLTKRIIVHMMLAEPSVDVPKRKDFLLREKIQGQNCELCRTTAP